MEGKFVDNVDLDIYRYEMQTGKIAKLFEYSGTGYKIREQRYLIMLDDEENRNRELIISVLTPYELTFDTLDSDKKRELEKSCKISKALKKYDILYERVLHAYNEGRGFLSAHEKYLSSVPIEDDKSYKTILINTEGEYYIGYDFKGVICLENLNTKYHRLK